MISLRSFIFKHSQKKTNVHFRVKTLILGKHLTDSEKTTWKISAGRYREILNPNENSKRQYLIHPDTKEARPTVLHSIST